jgi:hypothetical protein
MRGYLNFFLVFISVFFILSIIQASTYSNDISFSKAIAAERNYQAQMNFKEVALQSIRLGAIEGYTLYNITHDINKCDPNYVGGGGGPNHPLCFRIEEARIFAQAGAFTRLALLDIDLFDPDSELEFFCTNILTDDISREIASKKKLGITYCPGCNEFSTNANNATELTDQLITNAPKINNQPDFSKIVTPSCMSILYPEIEEDPLNTILPFGSKRNPSLKAVQINGYILSSIYSQKFGISSVAHIPAGFEVNV